MRSRLIASLSLILVFLGAVGCDLFESEEESVEIELLPDQKRYQVDQEVEFSATNESKQPLFVQFCGPDLIFTVQRRNDSWETYSGWVCPDLHTIEFKAVAGPGEVFRFSTVISEEGQYRTELTYKMGSEGKKQIANSGTFIVEK